MSGAALIGNHTSLNEQIPCLATTRVGGRTFTNVPAVRPSAPAAVQHGLREIVHDRLHHPVPGLPGSRLTSAATDFGLGARWKLPLNAFSGSFRASQTQGGLAANAIGQQGVQASPLAMALVAAGVDSGNGIPRCW